MKFIKRTILPILFVTSYFITVNAQNTRVDSLLHVINKAGKDTVKVEALISIGDLSNNNPDKQLEYFNEALKISQDLDYKIGIAKVYASYSVYYTNQSEFEKAVDFLTKAFDIFKELEVKDMEVATLGNMGNIYCYQGDFEKGLECFLDALDVMYELGDKSWIATAKNNIGSVYVYLSEDSLALQYYQEAFTMYDEIHDDKGMSLALGNIANIYNDLEEHNLAIKYYLQAVKLDNKTGSLQQLGLNCTNLATAYGDISDKKNAIKYFEKAVSVFKKLGNKNSLAITYLTLSYYYRDIDDFLTAKKYVNLSFEMAKELGTKHTLMKLYKELSFYDSNEGKYFSAFENYKKFSNLKDSIYKTEKSEQIAEMQTKFDTEQKEKENELLKERNVRNELINGRKNILIFSGLGLVFLMFIIGAIILKTSRLRKKNNEELREKNFEINQQKEEIIAQNELLHVQNDKIEKSHNKIKSSINYAKRIQEAMLPSDVVINQFMPEHFIFFKPRDVVSGDFYWVKKIKNQLVIVVADCTGHGVPGAMVSMLAMSLLNDVVNQETITHASQVLEELRIKIKKSFKQTGNIDEQKDGMDLALCAINMDTNVMQYSGANIPLYHYRNEELIIYKPVPNPIGISHKEIPFKNEKIKLEKEDTFYMFSDGIVDQFHYKSVRKLKASGLRKVLEEINLKPMNEQNNRFNELYNEWTGDLKNQTDDILVMGFKV